MTNYEASLLVGGSFKAQSFATKLQAKEFAGLMENNGHFVTIRQFANGDWYVWNF